jgi:hypothetical protein
VLIQRPKQRQESRIAIAIVGPQALASLIATAPFIDTRPSRNGY